MSIKRDGEDDGFVGVRQPWINHDMHRVRSAPVRVPVDEELTRRRALEYAASQSWWRGDPQRCRLIDAGHVIGPKDCVYLVRMGATDAFKIGMATDGLTRLSSLQTSSPVKLILAAWIGFFNKEPLRKAERFAHKRAQFINSRLKGEWFRLSQTQADKVVDEVVEEFREHVCGIGYDGDFFDDSI